MDWRFAVEIKRDSSVFRLVSAACSGHMSVEALVIPYSVFVRLDGRLDCPSLLSTSLVPVGTDPCFLALISSYTGSVEVTKDILR